MTLTGTFSGAYLLPNVREAGRVFERDGIDTFAVRLELLRDDEIIGTGTLGVDATFWGSRGQHGAFGSVPLTPEQVVVLIAEGTDELQLRLIGDPEVALSCSVRSGGGPYGMAWQSPT